MKFKKVLSALTVMLALTAVACNGGGNQSDAPKSNSQQSTSALPAIKVTAADNKKTLEVDETVKLTSDVEGVTWESANTAVATVDGEGLVTAVSAGSAKITAKKDGYKDGSITITVNAPSDPLLQPLERTYTEGTPAQNAAERAAPVLRDG